MEHWDEWKKLPNLFLHKVVSELCGWEGRCGMLHEAVCEDIADLSSVQVYASGSPAMIYAADEPGRRRSGAPVYPRRGRHCPYKVRT